MDSQAGILDLLKIQGEQALKKSRRALIIQPGAIGDCILTLPLAQFIINRLKLGAVDMLGRADYISYFPGRTCIDTIRAIDSVDMHRFFHPSADFHLTDRDALIDAFAGYLWIVTFLGRTDSDFEQNLIFTANCSQGADVITLPLLPASLGREHIADAYIRRLCEASGLEFTGENIPTSSELLIRPTKSDKQAGKELLQQVLYRAGTGQAGIDTDSALIVLCPGSGSVEKSWHLDNFLSLAEQLKSTGAEPLILLGPAEVERFIPHRLLDISRTAPFLVDLSLTQVLQVLCVADAYVGNDSGITHLAAAIGLDTFALFGPTDPSVYRPLGPNVCIIKDKTSDFTSQPSEELQRKVLLKLQEICA
jgi:ADP-heptose:LPS heptosyltransferase